jgi:hypothetical protein
MVNIVDSNKYILEIETDSCFFISIYEKNKSGFKKALMRTEALMQVKKILSAQILCSNSKEVAWSLGK